MYVANYGWKTHQLPVCQHRLVAGLNTRRTIVTDDQVPAPGAHPVALAETPNAQNLYVVNQGSNTVDRSFSVGSLDARDHHGRKYSGVGRRSLRQPAHLRRDPGRRPCTDRTDANTVFSQTNPSVGAAPISLCTIPSLNRLYVTNPSTGRRFMFSTYRRLAHGNSIDTPTLLATHVDDGRWPPRPAPAACSPVSVAALGRMAPASTSRAIRRRPRCSDPDVGHFGSLHHPAAHRVRRSQSHREAGYGDLARAVAFAARGPQFRSPASTPCHRSSRLRAGCPTHRARPASACLPRPPPTAATFTSASATPDRSPTSDTTTSTISTGQQHPRHPGHRPRGSLRSLPTTAVLWRGITGFRSLRT